MTNSEIAQRSAAPRAGSVQASLKKIVFVINHAGFFVTHRLALAIAARDAGYAVTVLTPRSRHVPLIQEKGLAWREVRLDRSSRNPLAELRTIANLVSLYRELRPDLVHHVTSKPVLYGTVAARVAGVPAVVNAVSGLGHVFTSRERSFRILRQIVGLGYRAALRHRNMRVIFQNEDDRQLFLCSGWLRKDQTVLIPGSGVDPMAFAPAASISVRPTVLFPARMLRTKGLIEFLEAVQFLNQSGVLARYILVGDADPDNPASLSEEDVRSRAAAAGIEYWGRRDDMPNVYQQADIVCLPSYREGMPKSLIEAASCALPIVTTDVPGCRDVVTDGENGFLVPARNSKAVAEALRTLIENAGLRHAMGIKGRDRVVSSLSLESIIRSTLSLYQQLMSSVR